MNNFEIGTQEADMMSPPISSETMGARFGITVRRVMNGVQEHLSEPYLMPSVQGRNGSTERTVPAIVHTPLGGMVPGPNAIPPAIPSGTVGAFCEPHSSEDMGFEGGVADSWPEGSPVPLYNSWSGKLYKPSSGPDISDASGY